MVSWVVSLTKSVLPALVFAGGGGLLLTTAFPPEARVGSPAARREALREAVVTRETDAGVAAVDAAMKAQWAELGAQVAAPAPELAWMRRLALALMGTVPSLEEVRLFESLPEGQRRAWWIGKVLGDPRFHDAFAERWARATVGVKDGPFLVYRRRRYVRWLAEEMAGQPVEGAPGRRVGPRMDALARQMIASEGLWTETPATNFLTVEYENDEKSFNEVAIAGRVSRAFLGLRLDCAECHDHPFESWRQADFHGMAAFFGQTQFSVRGVRDGREGDYAFSPSLGDEAITIAPKVPYGEEWLPPSGSRRERFAAWVTHPANEAFGRAVVNRVWGLMFGRPLHQPVDEIPLEGPFPAPLAELGAAFAEARFDLRWLITVIARSRAFGLDSRAEQAGEAEELSFSVFPLTQLRPEQMVGALIQSSSIESIDRESFWLSRLLRVTQENDFLKRYGDTGEDRFESGAGTIPQRLLLMNGKILRERIEPGPLAGGGRIAMLAPTDRAAIEALWLCVLTRRPTEREVGHFLGRLEATRGDARGQAIEDMHWTLLNSTEASWNH